MAKLEGEPSPADEESLQPDPKMVEASARNEVINSHARGVDRLLNEKLPKSLIDAVDERVEERVLSAERSGPDGTFLDNYVRSDKRGDEFGQLMFDLRAGKTLKEAVSEMEREMDGNIAKKEKHDEKLQGMLAFSQLLRECHQSWGEDFVNEEGELSRGREIELAKQRIQVSELLKSEVVKQEGRVNYVDGVSEEGLLLDSVSYDVSPPEATSVEYAYGEGADVSSPSVVEEPPEPKPELKSREAVFGREGISREDLSGIAVEIQKLLEQDTGKGAFAAAQQLGHLKRAGIKLSEKRKSAVFEKLNKQREAMGEVDAAEQARYLMYLKYLGAADEITDKEKEHIELGIVDRTSHDDLADLDRLCVNAKYLGVRESFDDIQPYLEKNYEQKLAQSDGEVQVAFARARRKYIGVSYELPEKHLQIENQVDRQLAQYQDKREWRRYARLKYVVDYVRGPAPVSEKTEEGMVQGIQAERIKARAVGKWQAYTAYVADAVSMVRRLEGVSEVEEMKRGEDSDAVQSLAGLEELKTSKERLRENLAEQKEKTPKPEAAVNLEAYPKRAVYEQRVGEHESQLQADEQGGPVLELSASELNKRGKIIRQRLARRRQDTSGQVEARVSKAVEDEKTGDEDKRLPPEDYQRLMSALELYPADDEERESQRQKHLAFLHSDMEHAGSLQGKWFARYISTRFERTSARFNVATGSRKLFQWKAGQREVIQAREDTVATMREAAMDESVDEQTRVLCAQMADELELVNIAEARGLGSADEQPPAAEQEPAVVKPATDREEFEAKVEEKYKKKYKRKLEKKEFEAKAKEKYRKKYKEELKNTKQGKAI